MNNVTVTKTLCMIRNDRRGKTGQISHEINVAIAPAEKIAKGCSRKPHL